MHAYLRRTIGAFALLAVAAFLIGVVMSRSRLLAMTSLPTASSGMGVLSLIVTLYWLRRGIKLSRTLDTELAKIFVISFAPVMFVLLMALNPLLLAAAEKVGNLQHLLRRQSHYDSVIAHAQADHRTVKFAGESRHAVDPGPPVRAVFDLHRDFDVVTAMVFDPTGAAGTSNGARRRGVPLPRIVNIALDRCKPVRGDYYRCEVSVDGLDLWK